MKNTQWESKKQAEVRAGSNNQNPRTIQSQKQKNKHKKTLGNAYTQYNKTSQTVNVNTRYI